MQRLHFGDLLPLVLVATGIAIVSTFFLGRLSKAERVRRTWLKTITGCGAPPPLLPAELRDDTARKLLVQWQENHEGGAWDRAIESGKSDPLLFAVAEFHGRPDLAKSVLRQLGQPEQLGEPYR